MFPLRRRLTKGYGAALVLHFLLNGPTLAQADIPTFTVKSDTYFAASGELPEVNANDVSIIEGNGFNVTFGSDWSQRIRDTVDAHCANGRSSECQDQVKQVVGLGTTEGGLQARVVPVLLLAGAVAVALVAELIMISHDEVMKADPVHIQIPQAEHEEMANWDITEGKFNMKPLDADAFEVDMVSFRPSSKPSSDKIPSAAMQDNGDLVLTVGDLAPVIDERFGHALCPRDVDDRRLVKRIEARCLANKVLALMRIFQEGGAAVNFQYIDPFDFPRPTDTLLQESYDQTRDTADRLLMRPDTPEEVRESVHEFANWIAFAESVGSYVFTDGKMTIPAKFIELQRNTEEEDDEEEGACPTESKKYPVCNSCGGNAFAAEMKGSIGSCIGLLTEEHTYEGCKCIVTDKISDGMDEATREAMSSMLQRVMNGETPSTPGKVKNKALTMILEAENRESDNYRWIFYETDQGQPAGCLTQRTVVFKGPVFHGANIVFPDPPSGEYDMTIWGRGCKFRGNGQNPGELLGDKDTYSCSGPSDSASTVVCPDGKQQHEGGYCDFDSDGSSSASEFTPGTCSFRMWQEFVYRKFNGGPVNMLFEGFKDNNGKFLGGEWGVKEQGKNVVGAGSVIEMKASLLPQPLKVEVSRFDGKPVDIANWKNSMHFKFTYGENSWMEYQDQPDGSSNVKQSCATKYTSVFDKGYRLTYDCKFSC